MIKLKEFVNNQKPPVQGTDNPFEKKPVVQQPKQQVKSPAQPVKQIKTPVPASKMQQGVNTEVSIQQQIFTIKNRLNQLSLNTIMRNFQLSLQTFKSKVTRNTEDKNLIQQYLSPLIGNLESLRGNIQSLELELRKLDASTKIEDDAQQ